MKSTHSIKCTRYPVNYCLFFSYAAAFSKKLFAASFSFWSPCSRRKLSSLSTLSSHSLCQRLTTSLTAILKSEEQNDGMYLLTRQSSELEILVSSGQMRRIESSRNARRRQRSYNFQAHTATARTAGRMIFERNRTYREKTQACLEGIAPTAGNASLPMMCS